MRRSQPPSRLAGSALALPAWALATAAFAVASTGCPPGDLVPDAGDVGPLDAGDLDAPGMTLPDVPITDFIPDAFVVSDANDDAFVEPPDAPFSCESCAPAGPCETLACTDACEYMPRPDGTDCMGDVCIAGACVPRVCGDGWREDGTGGLPREGCDDVDLSTEDACSPSCVPTVFVVEETEGGIDFPPGPHAGVGVDGAGIPLYVWTAALTTGAGAEIRARRFDVRGGRVDVESSLPIATGLGVGVDPHPVVAGLSDGGWIIAWEDRTIDSSDLGIAYRRVSADGSLGSVQRANTTQLLRQHQPAIAATSAGFVLVWSDESGLGRGEGSRVVLRAFSLTGPSSAEVVVSAPTGGDSASEPALSSNEAGRLALAWTVSSAAGREVRVQRFDGTSPVGSSATLDEMSSEAHSASVATLSTGEFVLAWTRRARDGGGDVRARTMTTGTGALGPIDLDTGASMAPLLAETEPAVAAISGGAYLVTYAVGREDTGAVVASVGAAPPELEILATALEEGAAGDVSLARGADGVWVSFGQRGGAPVMGPLRGVYGFYLPRN